MAVALFCFAAATALALQPKDAAKAEPQETVIRLAVQPRAAPRPALRHLLLPELKEMSPGNPIPNYLKSFLAQDFSADQEVLGPAALRMADRAARLDRPDWQIQLKLKTEGINLLIPDVQKIRSLATALQVRFREELSQSRFDDALVTARTMFAMSRHMSEHPTLIGALVGFAIAQVAIAPLEEMLERPGCPNLYWALANLPHPLVPLDQGLEGERVMIDVELRDLSASDPMGPDQLRKLVARVDLLRSLEAGKKGKSTREWLAERTRDEAKVRAARACLVEAGASDARVRLFPPEQVVLLDEKREYECRRDDELKHLKLPAWTIQALAARPRPAREPAFFDFLLPAFGRVRQSQGRLEQRLALLQHVEAIRIYAAEHDGGLPKQLADIDLPLPPDPFTGRPFLYAVEGGAAHVRGSPPPELKDNASFNLHYVVVIRK